MASDGVPAADRGGVRQRADGEARYAPVRPAPAGGGHGVLGSRSSADSGSPRHGDAHAVTVSRRMPLLLVPRTVERVEADGTRDRHRDILVLPG
ncbi:hypothetical protein AB0O67_04390 [Streptomyces sp. NPDC086077]|uniref:hypothetical protein n=1 Tax=Streptomyces sp. NPDC086077 TaxID=3154862 RepID=UPI0034213A26